MEYSARTGSTDKFRITHDMLPLGQYYIQDKSVDTTEDNMWFSEPGKGRKIRLYNSNHGYTHYLIHPCRHGTLGCIGLIGTDAVPLFKKLDEILDEQSNIAVTVKQNDAR